jgi:hypothetical protein
VCQNTSCGRSWIWNPDRWESEAKNKQDTNIASLCLLAQVYNCTTHGLSFQLHFCTLSILKKNKVTNNFQNQTQKRFKNTNFASQLASFAFLSTNRHPPPIPKDCKRTLWQEFRTFILQNYKNELWSIGPTENKSKTPKKNVHQLLTDTELIWFSKAKHKSINTVTTNDKRIEEKYVALKKLVGKMKR